MDATCSVYKIGFKPARDFFLTGNNPLRLFRELSELGICILVAHTGLVPELGGIEPEGSYLSWDIWLATDRDVAAIREVFIFVEDISEINIVTLMEQVVPGFLPSREGLGRILVERGELRPEDLAPPTAPRKPPGGQSMEQEPAGGSGSKPARAGQYLAFTMRKQNFAIEIHKVREVLDVSTLTRIPRLPDYLSGVINLRGKVVPVMDLGLKLGMAPIEKTRDTCIIIVEVRIDGTGAEMGVLTDSVQMVLDLPAEALEPVPKMGAGIGTEFIKGMGRLDDEAELSSLSAQTKLMPSGYKFLIILDLDAALATGARTALPA